MNHIIVTQLDVNDRPEPLAKLQSIIATFPADLLDAEGQWAVIMTEEAGSAMLIDLITALGEEGYLP